jgi:hypothetical protein
LFKGLAQDLKFKFVGEKPRQNVCSVFFLLEEKTLKSKSKLLNVLSTFAFSINYFGDELHLHQGIHCPYVSAISFADTAQESRHIFFTPREI